MNMSATKIRFFALLLGIVLMVIVGIAAVSVYASEGRLSLSDVVSGPSAAELSGEYAGPGREGLDSRGETKCPPVSDDSDAAPEGWAERSGGCGRFGNGSDRTEVGSSGIGPDWDRCVTRRGGRRNGSGPFGRFEGRDDGDGTAPLGQGDELIKPDDSGSGGGFETGMNGEPCPPMGPRTWKPRGEIQELRLIECPAEPDGGADNAEVSL